MDLKMRSERHVRAVEYALEQIRESELALYVKQVILYGSCARNEARWNSDVDLCLILTEDVRMEEKYRRWIHWLKGGISEDDIDCAEVDLKTFIGDDWEQEQSVFCSNIRRGGISIWQ